MDEREHLLVCLMEECAEVSQRASKALRFGILEIQPGQSFTNASRLRSELIDLLAVMEMLADNGAITNPLHISRASIEAKKLKVERYLEYSMGRTPNPAEESGEGMLGEKP